MTSSLSNRVLASLRCGVVSIDRTGTVTLLNPPAAEVLSMPPSGWEGRSCVEVFSHCPAFASVLLEALNQGTLPDRAELELDVGAAHKLLLGFSLSRIRGDDGEVLGAAMFFKDLTLVEEERERESLRSRLIALGEVAAQLAHELRNRLGGVRLFVGLARRRVASDVQTVGYLDRAEQEILAANDKMAQVLDFVRPLKLEVRPVEVEDLCRGAVEATLARFPDAPVKVSWDVAADLPLVLADEGRLRDALANLLSNALEAMNLSGRILVRLRRDDAVPPTGAPGAPIPGIRVWDGGTGRRVRIEITDDGPGMTEDVLRRIFQPFFTTKEEGTGLGVPAAQKILTAHGGSLDVRSSPGEGATFVLLVPAAVPEGEEHG